VKAACGTRNVRSSRAEAPIGRNRPAPTTG
jgi:hypothetical protein